MSDRRKKNAVYLIQVSEGFKPQGPWDLPVEFLGGTLYVKNLDMQDVTAFCRVFNKRQMALGVSDRQWAIPIRNARQRHWRTDAHAARDGQPEVQESGSLLSSVQEAGRALS